jgi:glyoxylase I family protein
VLTFREPQVILFSDDLARIIEFYSKLGFTETFRVPTAGEPIHVDLVLDGYKTGFSSMASSRDDHGLNPATEGQRATVTLCTDDTESAYRELTDGGAPALAAPHVWLDRLASGRPSPPRPGRPSPALARPDQCGTNAAKRSSLSRLPVLRAVDSGNPEPTARNNFAGPAGPRLKPERRCCCVSCCS